MKKIILLLLFCFSSMLYAGDHTECELKPEKVWLNLVGDTVWINFEGGGAIYKSFSNSEITERHLNSMYSAGMAAISAGKSLIVRYPEVGYDCALAHTGSRNDVLGFWYK